jgi:hypothetical protein
VRYGMGTPKMLVETWKRFLTEREYTDQEWEEDILWNDKDRMEINGFFWGTGDGTLELFTTLIADLAKKTGISLETETRNETELSAWREFRDEAMEHKTISIAYDTMAPDTSNITGNETTKDASPLGRQRQVSQPEKNAENMIDNLIDDVIASLSDRYSSEEILDKILVKTQRRKG